MQLIPTSRHKLNKTNKHLLKLDNKQLPTFIYSLIETHALRKEMAI